VYTTSYGLINLQESIKSLQEVPKSCSLWEQINILIIKAMAITQRLIIQGKQMGYGKKKTTKKRKSTKKKK
jgi:hypothetical protein